MTLTDREKALVEAARLIAENIGRDFPYQPEFVAALRAYDPPKPAGGQMGAKISVTDFCKGLLPESQYINNSVHNCIFKIAQEIDAIKANTAKDAE